MRRTRNNVQSRGQAQFSPTSNWLYEGEIIDGRNRHLACEKAGVEPRFREWDGQGSLVASVVSLNLHRRHLSESQRAMEAAKIATLQDGQRQVGQLADVPIQEEAAELLNVGERSVRRASQARTDGTLELVTAVEQGKAAVSTAADLTEFSHEEQQEIVVRGEKEIIKATKKICSRKREQKRAEIKERLEKVAASSKGVPIHK